MPKKGLLRAALIAVAIASSSLPSATAYAQRERTVQAAAEDDSPYGGRFFDQLRSIFGRFRAADLERAFQSATAISCSELVNDKGEWRPVAFFNENRKLGDWYRGTIEEVRSDLAVYIFKGVCSAERSPLQVTTKFPIDESIDAFNAGRIPFERIDVNVNPPVSVIFDSRSEAYTFDLPFLFLRERNDGGNIYSLIAPRLSDRYARDVTDHWDCKGVTAEDVTYQFLICRTSLTEKDPVARNQRRGPSSFGSSAFFILSDGREATSSVKLVGANNEAIEPSDVDEPPPPALTRPPFSREPGPLPADAPPNRRESIPYQPPISDSGWRLPDFWSKLVQLDRGTFRLQMSPQTWTGKIGSSQILIDQKMTSADAVAPPLSSDYCIWKPASTRELDRLLSGADTTDYVLSSLPSNSRTPASLTFDMKTFTGLQLGSLQCYFPRVDSPDAVSYDRWINVVGAHITLQVRQ